MTNDAAPRESSAEEVPRLGDCLNELSEQKRIVQELAERVVQLTSELAAANEALRESERNSRLVVDSIPGLVALLATDGNVQFVNRQIVEYTGRTLEELKNWGSDDTVHPDDLPHVIDVFTRSIASGNPYEIQQRLRRSDGAYRWFQNNGFPLRDTTGHIVRWCVLLTDVDDRKRAEDGLRESERTLKLIIDTIPALAWSARPDGSADFFNQHYFDYMGLSPDQTSDWRWTAAVHPDDASNLVATWRHILESEAPGEAEARLRRHDGEYRWFLERANPLRDETGKIVKWYGVNTDITDRKRAEEELRRSEAFLKQAQRLTLTGSIWWKVATGEVTWSEETFRLLDVPKTVTPTVELALSRVHPEDLAVVQERVDRSVREGVNMDLEHRFLMPDGSVKHVHVLLQNVALESGTPEFVGAVQDVTASKMAQEALNKADAELARVSRVAALSALTASIAHEINQPLSGIITNAGTCLRMLNAAPPDIEGACETARRTIRDGNRASDVITRLRALFSSREFTLESLDLNEAAREVVALSSNDLQRNRIVLQSEFAGDLPIVTGDRVQLQQVILNLLRNASDAMVDVHDRPRQLLITTEREDSDRVRLSVRDAGVGLSPQSLDSVFDAFYTTKSGGMGIGLFVCRSIIEKHHGRLWAEPNPGGPGATFSFSVPRGPATDTNV
jgi:PAS domain S-box-containing protein